MQAAYEAFFPTLTGQVTLGELNKSLRGPGLGIGHWLWGGGAMNISRQVACC